MSTETDNKILQRLNIAKTIANFLGWEIKYNSDITIPLEFYTPNSITELETGVYENYWYAFDFVNNINWDILHYIIDKISKLEDNSPAYFEIVNAPITTPFQIIKEKVIQYILNLK